MSSIRRVGKIPEEWTETMLNAVKRYGRNVPLLAWLWAQARKTTGRTHAPSGKVKIARHIGNLRPNDELRVVFGGHWSDNPGWLLLDERDQDITSRLAFDDGSVDVVFSEHVIEHVPFVGGAQFLRESYRILKPGGICRVTCPMLDRLMSVDLSGDNGRTYVRNSILPHFATEQAFLRDLLHIDAINTEPLPFLFNALYMGHGHRFIWNSGLMIKVMTAVGFRDVQRRLPGEGLRADYCIERRRRGIYLGYEWQEELLPGQDVFDAESFVVEALK